MAINLQCPTRPGISPEWKPRKSFVSSMRKVVENAENSRAMYDDMIAAYIARGDQDNDMNVTVNYLCRPGGRHIYGALLAMLKGNAWESDMSRGLTYDLAGRKMFFYWHYRFEETRPRDLRPLQLFSHLDATYGLGFSLLVGQFERAVEYGYLAHAALNQSYHVKAFYHEWHNRGIAFMIRLFADWQEFSGHVFPAWGYDEPIYEGLLALWRTASADEIEPWLLAACDRHTHQSRNSTEKKAYDFSNMTHFPLEILMVLRLRQHLGLDNPVLDHPLMAPPWDRLPDPVPPYPPDALIEGCLHRARKDWPDFDRQTSLETLRAAAVAS